MILKILEHYFMILNVDMSLSGFMEPPKHHLLMHGSTAVDIILYNIINLFIDVRFKLLKVVSVHLVVHHEYK